MQQITVINRSLMNGTHQSNETGYLYIGSCLNVEQKFAKMLSVSASHASFSNAMYGSFLSCMVFIFMLCATMLCQKEVVAYH